MRLRDERLGNVRGDLVAGLVVALALIPEAIAFSIIAGVDRRVGLYASFSIAAIISITGGRPGMISAVTAATVMIMVWIGTFSWGSIRTLREHPKSSSVVMLATVAGVVLTNNLAIGVPLGVLLSGLLFTGKIAQIFLVASTASPEGAHRVYVVERQVFFASSDAFLRAFDFREALERVTIDLSRAHIWDISSVAALDMAVLKFRREGAEVEVIGLNKASGTIVDKLGVAEKPGALDKMMGH